MLVPPAETAPFPAKNSAAEGDQWAGQKCSWGKTRNGADFVMVRDEHSVKERRR